MPILNLENPTFVSVDGAGRPNAGGAVGVYVAGTSFGTLATIYSDQIKTSELANPITLDDAGTKEIWYDVKVDIREKTKAGVLIRDTLNLDPNATASVSTGFNLAQNGSFETDSDSDGQPDSWTISPYSGSDIAITESVVTDGIRALEFNTGAAGSGGGTATSAKFPVTEGTVCSVAWSFYATNATTLNTFQIKWYDESDVLQSTSTLTMPASGSVPTSWTNYREAVTADADATQGEIVLTGISSGGSNLNSKAYFDGIIVINSPNTATAKNPVLDGSLTGTAIGRGCLVYLDLSQSIADNVVSAILFDQESYDTDNIHDNSTNTDRLTVPTGVTKIRLNAQVGWASNATGNRELRVYKNGVLAWTGSPRSVVTPATGTNFTYQSVSSSVIDVIAGDYFTLEVYQDSGGALNALGTANGERTHFGMEIIK